MSDENYLDFITSENRTRRIESWDIENARSELAQLRADLQAAYDEVVSMSYEVGEKDKRIAEQALQLEQARLILHDVEKPELSTLADTLREMKNIIDPEEALWIKWIDKQANAIDAWLAANAPQPQEQ